MKKWIAGLVLLPAALAAAAPLFQDDFRNGLSAWVVEQRPGGSVVIAGGRMLINDAAGCTVWFREALVAPVTIRYRAKVSSAGRVSDLNCFWMASDPARPDDLFGPGHTRTGKFGTYDTLRTYYVGYGGNTNSTTRFRRYDGSGARPLRAEHDLTSPEFLLQPDHVYDIMLVAGADGRIQYIRDGEVLFDWTDPAPLRRGWFGFRTVWSRIEITDFQVQAGTPGAGAR